MGAVWGRTPLATELRAWIRERHAALRAMGHLVLTAQCEPAWWSAVATADTDIAVECWWIDGVATRRPCHARVRDAAEAIVLLVALAQVDSDEYGQEVMDVWPPDDGIASIRSMERIAANARRVMGIQFSIHAFEDLKRISARVRGLVPLSDIFVAQFMQLERQLGTTAFRPRPIPVRLILEVPNHDQRELAAVLGQIVDDMVLHRQQSQLVHAIGDRARAAVCSNFEIVDLDFREWPPLLATPQSLACFARLAELGVRVRQLPVLRDSAVLGRSAVRLSVLTSLRVLLPSRPRDETSRCLATENVVVYEDTPYLVPALLSAVQVSQQVKRVKLWLEYNPHMWLGYKDSVDLWRWAAYALFSRHACRHVEVVVLPARVLHTLAIAVMEPVINANDPLAEVFETTSADYEWLTATRFSLRDMIYPSSRADYLIFEAPEPLTVRVVSRQLCEGVVWWRVLLPWCGEAWVNDANVLQATRREDRLLPVAPERRGLRFEFEDLTPNNMPNVLSFLRLVRERVQSIVVRTVFRAGVNDSLDVTDWALDVLRVCPTLEMLTLPSKNELTELRGLVQAAESGSVRLKYLALEQVFCSDRSDVIDFMEVLSDVHHPLTRHLEELQFAVSCPEIPIRAFKTAWQRMLDRNRTLHTVQISLVGTELPIDNNDRVAIRTAPLTLASKLAFLSVAPGCKDVRDRACCRLDRYVVAIIFALAAQHREREISIRSRPVPQG